MSIPGGEAATDPVRPGTDPLASFTLDDVADDLFTAPSVGESPSSEPARSPIDLPTEEPAADSSAALNEVGGDTSETPPEAGQPKEDEAKVPRRTQIAREHQAEIARLVEERITAERQAEDARRQIAETQRLADERIETERKQAAADEAARSARYREAFSKHRLPDDKYEDLLIQSSRGELVFGSPEQEGLRVAIAMRQAESALTNVVWEDLSSHANKLIEQRERAFFTNVASQLADLAKQPGVDEAAVRNPTSIKAAGEHLYQAGASSREPEIVGLREQLANAQTEIESLRLKVAAGATSPKTGGQSPNGLVRGSTFSPDLNKSAALDEVLDELFLPAGR